MAVVVARVAGWESRGHGKGKTGGAARSTVAVRLDSGMVEAGKAMQRGWSTDGQGVVARWVRVAGCRVHV